MIYFYALPAWIIVCRTTTGLPFYLHFLRFTPVRYRVTFVNSIHCSRYVTMICSSTATVARCSPTCNAIYAIRHHPFALPTQFSTTTTPFTTGILPLRALPAHRAHHTTHHCVPAHAFCFCGFVRLFHYTLFTNFTFDYDAFRSFYRCSYGDDCSLPVR